MLSDVTSEVWVTFLSVFKYRKQDNECHIQISTGIIEFQNFFYMLIFFLGNCSAVDFQLIIHMDRILFLLYKLYIINWIESLSIVISFINNMNRLNTISINNLHRLLEQGFF